MKFVILTVFIAAVAASPVVEEQKWPWQVGKVYHYNVYTHTYTKYDTSDDTGNTFKAEFVINVKAPGHLLAKLVDPQYAPLKKPNLPIGEVALDVKYEPIKDFDKTFEIFVDGGRIVSLKVPSSYSNNQENLLKGLISGLQIDVSTLGYVDDYPNGFDKESFQGVFKKWETDISGKCQTLYSVVPLQTAEWHHLLPEYVSEENPIKITKSKNYDSCQDRVGPKQDLIDYTAEGRVLVGKQGTIYKSQVATTLLNSPLLTGKQKVEVFSYVQFHLKSVDQNNDTKWPKAEQYRSTDSLVFKLDNNITLYTYNGEHNVAKAQKLLQVMTPLLQDPNALTKNEFLIQYEILVTILRTLNSEQFNQLTNSVEIAKSSKNVAKHGMWIIYRDAVAQTGNQEAFVQIKSWVLNKKIEGEEAAQVITAFGAAVSHPSKALIVDFFNFAKSPEVIEQRSVQNSALLAVTKLLRYANQDQFVVETVIPYFEKELKLAVEDAENSKAQVYVRVLGNLAYPEILKVFAPYFEGKIAVSKYLRTQLVTNLKTLANLKNPYVRAVLYNILKNTAEPYEVRVAAALNIFLSFPTPEMWQVMAQMTHTDPSTQVRAVLANSITFAAGLKEPQFAELAKNAQAVLYKTVKEKFGYYYSTDSLVDSYTDEDEFSFFKELSFIGSEDHIAPKYHRSAFRFNNNGFDDENQLTLSVSDVQDLISYFVSKFNEPTKTDTTFKFSAKQLTEALNIKRATRQPLEAALFVDNFNQQKLITFSEKELTEFFVDLMDKFQNNIASGIDVHYTKILNTKEKSIILPLAAGVPFLYLYNEPLLVVAQIQTKLVANTNQFTKSIESTVDITIARNLEGSVGYFDTIKDKIVVTGVVKKIQLRFPAKITTSYSKGGHLDVKFEPLQTEKDIKLIQYYVWPFVASQEKDSLVYDFEILKRPQKTFSIDTKIGYWTNMFYHLNGYTYSADFNKPDLFSDDLLTSIGNFFYHKDIAWTEFEYTYLSKESTTKAVTFSVYFEKLYNQNNEGELGRATLPKNKEGNSAARREELIKKVSAGIKSGQVEVYDFTAKFDAVKKIEYSFTSAVAYSLVDPKVQAGFFAHGTTEEFSAVLQLSKQDTKIVPFNFEEALKNKINITYDLDIIHQNNVNIRIQGYGERSDTYTEQLRNDPKGKKCLKDVSKNNFYQLDCHKLLIKAHTPDFFKNTIQFQNIDKADWTQLINGYNFVKGQNLNEQLSHVLKKDEHSVTVELQAFYYENYIAYELDSQFGLFSARSDISGYYPYALSIYESLNSYERTCNWFTRYQAYPYCAIDDSKVKTFSGRSYDYSLTGSWHVVMLDEADYFKSWNDLVILARRPKANQEEVYISYKTDSGKYFEIDIKPDNIEVKTNGEKVLDGALTLYFDDVDEVPLLEYYDIAEGFKVFNIRDDTLQIVYDKHRLVIFTEEHRNTTTGICGLNSGQIGDDYWTPWGLVDDSKHYGASFALEDESSDSKTVSLKKEAKEKAYQPVTMYTKILFTDASWSKVLNKSIKKI